MGEKIDLNEMGIIWKEIEFSLGARHIWNGINHHVSVFYGVRSEVAGGSGWYYRFQGARPQGPFKTDEEAKQAAQEALRKPNE